MADKITNYQCPACTGPLHFSVSEGKLVCDYCGSSFDPAEIEALYAEKEKKAAGEDGKEEPISQNKDQEVKECWDTSGMSSDWGEDSAKMRAYNCPSCGAELICDETTAATSCPYCGNPTIISGQFAGTLKPDLVIPFRLDKKAAIAALKNHYKGKMFLPKSFTDGNHIEEIKGVYVPFWLFNGEAYADVTFDATTSFIRHEGVSDVTVTRHFEVQRAGAVTFEKIPVDASSRMPDDYMDSIEPYIYDDLKPFSTAYLPGFLADKYDVSADSCAERADERCRTSAIAAMQNTVGNYETCRIRTQKIDLRRGEVKYALFPVWLLNTKWNGESFLFAMNGQTGKMVGDLPVSRRKFWITFAVIALIFAVLMALIIFVI